MSISKHHWMRRRHLLFWLPVGPALVLFSATAWAAAIGTSVGRLHWEQMTLINAIPWGHIGSSTARAAEDEVEDEDRDFSGTPSPSTSAFAQVGDTWGRAFTDGDVELGEAVQAKSTNMESASARARAFRSVDFVAESDGEVIVEIPFEVSISFFTDLPGESATGMSSLGLELYSYGDGFDDFAASWKDFMDYALEGGSNSFGASGLLSVRMTFEEGQEGYLEATVYNSADAQGVPLPATVLLLSSGLAGLLGFGLRKRFQRLGFH